MVTEVVSVTTTMQLNMAMTAWPVCRHRTSTAGPSTRTHTTAAKQARHPSCQAHNLAGNSPDGQNTRSRTLSMARRPGHPLSTPARKLTGSAPRLHMTLETRHINHRARPDHKPRHSSPARDARPRSPRLSSPSQQPYQSRILSATRYGHCRLVDLRH
jgi:hypothetical protein